MPARIVPLVTDQFYHLFNRGINKQPIFWGTGDYHRFLEVLDFYSFASVPIRFSKFLGLSKEQRRKIWDLLKRENKKLVNFVSFCLIPNHFHFLVRQELDDGISKFMRCLQDSYTRYFNTKHHKLGPILQGQFKAVRIEDENQLLHLSRYIHLNPYSSFVVKTVKQLETYPYSSFLEYLGDVKNKMCLKQIILAHFQRSLDYQKFVFNQADYQRNLEQIKHLLIEKD